VRGAARHFAGFFLDQIIQNFNPDFGVVAVYVERSNQIMNSAGQVKLLLDPMPHLLLAEFSLAELPDEGMVPKGTPLGHEAAGLQLPDIAVPLGTYTGWNLLSSAPRDECSAMGSFIPFAKTKAERIAAGDPRASLEERYQTHGRYVKEVEAAAEWLVSEGLLLREDAIAYVEAAKTRDLGLPR
jgi:hypothetical protein